MADEGFLAEARLFFPDDPIVESHQPFSVFQRFLDALDKALTRPGRFERFQPIDGGPLRAFQTHGYPYLPAMTFTVGLVLGVDGVEEVHFVGLDVDLAYFDQIASDPDDAGGRPGRQWRLDDDWDPFAADDEPF